MKTVNIHLTPKMVNDAVEWEMKVSGDATTSKKGGSKFDTIDVGRNSRFKFHVDIKDPNHLDIRFSDDPLWAYEGVSCPPPKGISTDQIVQVHKQNKRQLDFVDLNKGDETTIVYQLNFVNAAGEPVTPLDPDIRNGGGTGGGPGQGFFAALLALGAGAVAYLFYKVFFRP